METYSAIGAQEEGLHLRQKKVLKLCEFVIVVWYVIQNLVVVSKNNVELT